LQHSSVPGLPGSLAGAASGDYVRIEAIMVGSLRTRCEEMGVRVGDVLYCSSAGRASMLLRTGDGRFLSLERDWARYVRVGRQWSQPSGEWPASHGAGQATRSPPVWHLVESPLPGGRLRLKREASAG
jgi:hypothetical protein